MFPRAPRGDDNKIKKAWCWKLILGQQVVGNLTDKISNSPTPYPIVGMTQEDVSPFSLYFEFPTFVIRE